MSLNPAAPPPTPQLKVMVVNAIYLTVEIQLMETLIAANNLLLKLKVIAILVHFTTEKQTL